MSIPEIAKYSRLFLLVGMLAIALHAPAHADDAPATSPGDQTGSPPATQPAAEDIGNPPRDLAAADQFAGQTVVDVRVVGNSQVTTTDILNLVRTKSGDKFDPATVVEDYQRIYNKMRRFANITARVEPADKGVIVIFEVTEQKQIHSIQFVGNTKFKTHALEEDIDLKPGQVIDRFRINQSRDLIEKEYHDKNFPYAHVTIDEQALSANGDLIFNIVEAPQVKIRKVDFIGNNTFSTWRLKDEIKTGYYIFIFRPGTFDPEQVEEDVASLRKFYQDKGFFDAHVGRKLTRSPDMKEMEVTFLVDEGPRYIIDHVEFPDIAHHAVSEATLRQNMVLLEGKPYDKDGVDKDILAIVKQYSKAGGYIYDQQPGIAPNPQYLQIEPKTVFEKEPGKLTLVYEISEGKQFTLGRILVKGNAKTKDNVILREMHMRPGQQYDSSEVQDAADRLRGTPYFSSVSVTPVGDDPTSRDLQVEVEEARTAQVSAGVGVNSNGGFGGQLSYEQKNFDITNWPSSYGELFSDRAFTGAGQDFLISFEPGTEGTDADVSFTEPYLFDQPYSLTTEGYLRERIRENYTDFRPGTRITVGERFNYIYSADVFLRAEDVDIRDIQDPTNRPAEILNGAGHHTLTSAGLDFRRDTTNHGPITYKGTDTEFGFEEAGAMSGEVNYTRITASFNEYQELSEDLLGRKTVLNARLDYGDDLRKAPFYERFYGGGIGSIRGFEFRGVSPRAGPENDQIGGDFAVTGGLELGFPLVEDFLRGVLFFDAGDVEATEKLGTIRTSVGFGVRLVLPFFGQQPLALDLGFPLTENPQDQRQIFSFSFGVSR